MMYAITIYCLVDLTILYLLFSLSKKESSVLLPALGVAYNHICLKKEGYHENRFIWCHR